MRVPGSGSRAVMLAIAVWWTGSAGAGEPWLVFRGHGYVEVPPFMAPAPATEMTVEAWVYLASHVSQTGSTCISLLGRGWTQSYWLGVCGGRLRLYTHGSGTSVDGDTPVPLGRWVHVAAVYDGDTVAFYVDGELDTEVPAAAPPPMPDATEPLRIGSDVSWEESPVGMIDRVRIWGVARPGDALVVESVYDLPPGGADGLLLSLNFPRDELAAVYEDFATNASLAGEVYLGDGVSPCVVERWIPAGAHATGFGGSQWRTDVDIVNLGALDNRVEVTFHPKGAGAPTAPVVALLEANGILHMGDVVLDRFGMSTTGALRVCATYPVRVSSRTYNLTPEGTTYGQGIPGVGLDRAVRSAVLPAVSEDGAFRTNLGLVNPGLSAVTVRVTVRDGGGTELGSFEQPLGPGEFTQIDRVCRKVTDAAVTGGSIALEVMGDGAVLAYTSLVDEVTGDGTFLLAE